CCQVAVIRLRSGYAERSGRRPLGPQPVARPKPIDQIEPAETSLSHPELSGWGPYPDEGASRPARDEPMRPNTSRRRPPIGADPLLWKELYVDSSLGAAELRALVS